MLESTPLSRSGVPLAGGPRSLRPGDLRFGILRLGARGRAADFTASGLFVSGTSSPRSSWPQTSLPLSSPGSFPSRAPCFGLLRAIPGVFDNLLDTSIDVLNDPSDIVLGTHRHFLGVDIFFKETFFLDR